MPATIEPTIDVQKNYWKHWNSRSQYPHDRALRRGNKILAYLLSLRLERPAILDKGCGMGWFANQLAQFGPTTGIDLSDDAIAQAKSKFPNVTFHAGNVLAMELPERRFDVVVSQEVIAHVPDQPGYVERAASVLKPGGHLILTTPNRFVHERAGWPDQPPGHIERWLYRSALRRLLRPQFRVLRSTTAVPLGNRGVLRVINSGKLTRLGGLLLGAERVEAFKEWAGFGWTQIVLAQKRS
jgi:2-polyprenyl-3-methyl-5-hydroxy-6-metoxy-1,4-benzoquinol methylase